MKVEIILDDAKSRVVKMIDEHCWDIIKDLLKDINESSDRKNVQSIKDIELTLDMIKDIQRFKEKTTNGIKSANGLYEILELCKGDNVVNESEEDIISAFFGYEIQIN